MAFIELSKNVTRPLQIYTLRGFAPPVPARSPWAARQRGSAWASVSPTSGDAPTLSP